jgi:antitoxin (DNA-binding transcriptional repressor) of toxin-antitoxin stability system
MKQLSATDVARRFSDVLDSVEASGETFVVVRHGRAVARITPDSTGSGQALKQALRRHRPDADWADELRELRESVGPGTDPWRA